MTQFRCSGCHQLGIELAVANKRLAELDAERLSKSANFNWEVGVKTFDIGNKCPKCNASTPATVEHVPLLADVVAPLEAVALTMKPRSEIKKRLTPDEHIRRECTLCGFAWAEATLDVASRVPGPPDPPRPPKQREVA